MTYSPGDFAPSTSIRAFADSSVSAVSSQRNFPSFSTLNTSSGAIIQPCSWELEQGLYHKPRQYFCSKRDIRYWSPVTVRDPLSSRSEERRVGKECRYRWSRV